MATKHNDSVKEFISEFWTKNFRSPSIREIGEHINIKSTGHIRYILNQLGYIAGDGSARQLIPNWVKKAITEFKGDKSE